MKKKVLVTANDFGSSKTNPGQRPKHHFCFGDMGKKVKYYKRGDMGKCQMTRRYEVFPAQAIHMLLKIPAARTPQGALKLVALIIKILSSNKKYFFHGLRSKLPQLFYFRKLGSPTAMKSSFHPLDA
jgi:hypothetical protein